MTDLLTFGLDFTSNLLRNKLIICTAISSPSVMLYLYTPTMCPVIVYCCLIWAGTPACHLSLLGGIQQHFANLVGHNLASSLDPDLSVALLPHWASLTGIIIDGAPTDSHWLFYLTVPLAAPHISPPVHVLILKPSVKLIPSDTHQPSSRKMPYFGIDYLYPSFPDYQ